MLIKKYALFPSSFHYAGTRGKARSVFAALRRDKGASKYNEADVSAFLEKVFPLAPTPCSFFTDLYQEQS